MNDLPDNLYRGHSGESLVLDQEAVKRFVSEKMKGALQSAINEIDHLSGNVIYRQAWKRATKAIRVLRDKC